MKRRESQDSINQAEDETMVKGSLTEYLALINIV